MNIQSIPPAAALLLLEKILGSMEDEKAEEKQERPTELDVWYQSHGSDYREYERLPQAAPFAMQFRDNYSSKRRVMSFLNVNGIAFACCPSGHVHILDGNGTDLELQDSFWVVVQPGSGNALTEVSVLSEKLFQESYTPKDPRSPRPFVNETEDENVDPLVPVGED